MSALRLELSPSPRFALLIVALHAAAALAALAVVPGIAGAALGVALLALGATTAWSRALLRSGAAVRSIELEGSGAALTAALTLRSGERLAAELAERRYVTRFAVALTLRRPVGRTLFVTPDMLDVKSFRALRLWALWGKLPAVATKQLRA